MHLEQQIKEFAINFSKNKQTHIIIEEPTCDPSASYYPSIAFVVASNPTQIARLIPASINKEQQIYCNIQMPIYLNKLNLLNMKHIYHSRVHCIRNKNINRYIYGKMNNNIY